MKSLQSTVVIDRPDPCLCLYKGAGKSLARPGKKHAMFLSEGREFPSASCLAGKKKLDDNSLLDVVQITRVPDMFPSLFPSWSG